MAARQPANGHRAAPVPAADWAAAQYQPDPNARLLRCHRHGCGAKYLDDEPSRQAHIAVFGHSPRTPEPANSPQENPP